MNSNSLYNVWFIFPYRKIIWDWPFRVMSLSFLGIPEWFPGHFPLEVRMVSLFIHTTSEPSMTCWIIKNKDKQIDPFIEWIHWIYGLTYHLSLMSCNDPIWKFQRKVEFGTKLCWLILTLGASNGTRGSWIS